LAHYCEDCRQVVVSEVSAKVHCLLGHIVRRDIGYPRIIS